MTIEVRELVIRASIAREERDGAGAAALAEALERLQRDLVRTCVAQVLDQLRQAGER